MFIEFTVIKSRQTLEKQWAYIVQRGKKNGILRVKKFFVRLLVATILYLLLYFLTSSEDFIILKGVGMMFIALAWLAFIVFTLFVLAGNLKTQRKFGSFLSSFPDEHLNYSVQIDEEKIVVKSTGYTNELLWKEFHRYGIHQETLYVFNDIKGIDSLFLDQHEIGSEVYTTLLDLLQKKGLNRAF